MDADEIKSKHTRRGGELEEEKELISYRWDNDFIIPIYSLW